MDQIVQDFLALTNDKKMTPAQVKVLGAAIQLFANQGYASTSTASVAKEAGVSQAVIFKYFSNKEGLLEQILAIASENLLPQYGEHFIQKLNQEAGKNSFEQLIAFALKDRFEFICANGNVLTILFSQVMVDDQLIARLQTVFLDKFQSLTQILEKVAGPKATLSGVDILRLVGSQLLLLFLETQRLHLKMSEEAVEQRILAMTDVIVNAVYQHSD
ncbi:TetR/AcrR family transcriptional regulator [Fructobacillus parabroussonetiae]|uniref:TetR/AcrR family transcriptional regulator n=1 Tax=Fructobacillus parabroussonetiae TaxID=2713174 RepID=A0ABS5QVP3_9LACO|nr:TetR/AcrR family transcriptional regulator [Fructobacillus parabroussonetiae]MBS9337270.1 TetR/AcrR family transcriptional regulator [Fructobacillus parabroussonetiae]